jgi:hypothetical protein
LVLALQPVTEENEIVIDQNNDNTEDLNVLSNNDPI